MTSVVARSQPCFTPFVILKGLERMLLCFTWPSQSSCSWMTMARKCCGQPSFSRIFQSSFQVTLSNALVMSKKVMKNHLSSSRSLGHAHTRTRAHAHTRTRAHAHTRTRAHAHMRTRAHAHTHTRTHTRTHTHTHTHTHTRTHARTDLDTRAVFHSTACSPDRFGSSLLPLRACIPPRSGT